MRSTVTLIVSLIVVAGLSGAAQKGATGTNESPESALKAATNRELATGDLASAIQQYRQIVTRYRAASPPVAAHALIQMAASYEKLGSSEAKKAYEEVLRDFSTQSEAVATARARLSHVGPSGGVVARQLWKTIGNTEVAIASDGRTAAVVDSASQEIQIRDLVDGQLSQVKVTTDATTGEYAEWPALSPDLKQVAYAFAGPETKWAYQVRVSAMQGGVRPKPLGTLSPYTYVRGWSADGKSVLVNMLDDGSSAHIGWLSTSDGSLKTLKSVNWQGLGLVALSPDGRFIAYDMLVEAGKPEREIRVLASDASAEYVVVRGSGINQGPVWSRDGARLAFTSNRSGSFGIWSVPIRNGREDGAPTQLKADIGDVGLVGFTAMGSLLYEQKIGTRDIFAMDIDPQGGALRGTPTRLADTYIGLNLNPSLSPDGKSVAYLSQRTQMFAGNISNLVIRSLESGAERVIPTIFRGGGKPMWLPDGQAIVELGRNAQNHTTIYKVDLQSGETVSLIDTGTSAPQTAAISRDGRTVYAGASNNAASGGNHVAGYDLRSGRRTDFPHFGTLRSLAASPDGHSIAFVANDTVTRPYRAELFVADADGRNIRTVFTTDKMDEIAFDLAWSADGRFIYFVKRASGSLWRVAAAGGSPTLVGELSKAVVSSIAVSADGRRIIYGVGAQPAVEVWALDNLESNSRK